MVPDDWQQTSLSEAGVQILDGDRGSNYPSEGDFFDTGYCLFLTAKNVTKSGFRFDECQFITQQKHNELRKGQVLPGDLVLTTRGSVGNIALFDASVPYKVLRINSGMVVLRPQ